MKKRVLFYQSISFIRTFNANSFHGNLTHIWVDPGKLKNFETHFPELLKILNLHLKSFRQYRIKACLSFRMLCPMNYSLKNAVNLMSWISFSFPCSSIAHYKLIILKYREPVSKIRMSISQQFCHWWK